MRRFILRAMTAVVLQIVGTGLLAPGASATGSFAGNGADNIEGEWYSAWFLGSREVKWCIDIAPDFGITKKQAYDTIDMAFDNWRLYLDIKGLRKLHTSDKPFPLLNTKYQEACGLDTDLTFYLGTVTAEVQDGMSRYANPVAFSRATDYDFAARFGKGYVWLKKGAPSDGLAPGAQPDWSHWPNFRGIIMHEIGHILGCRHIPGTIMSEDIAKTVLSARFPKRVDLEVDPFVPFRDWMKRDLTEKERKDYDGWRSQFLQGIDYSRELWFEASTGLSLFQVLFIKDLTQFDPDDVDRSNAGYDSVQAQKSYKFLTGKDPMPANMPQPAINDGLFSRFLQYKGVNSSQKIVASYGTMDFRTYRVAANTLRFEHPDAWNFVIEFDQPKTNQRSTLSDNMIFRRFVDDYTYPLYNPTMEYTGKIVKRRRGGSAAFEAVNIPVKYTRNLGRYLSATFWDDTLAKLEIFDGNEYVLMFRGIVGQQSGFGKDSYFVPISGATPIPANL